MNLASSPRAWDFSTLSAAENLLVVESAASVGITQRAQTDRLRLVKGVSAVDVQQASISSGWSGRSSVIFDE